jgi:hypothetical protein
MQGAGPFSWRKKLAKVNIPSILLGLGKASYMKTICAGNGQLL